MVNINVGGDPEVGVTEKDSSYVIPPIVLEDLGILKRIGTLEELRPNYHPVYYDDFALRIIGDGAAFEANFKQPFSKPEDMYETFTKFTEILQDLVYPYEVKLWPTLHFNLNHPLFKEIYGTPEESDRLWSSCEFGCDTQFNIWEEFSHASGKILNARNHQFRYFGGHVHVSTEEIKNPHNEIELFVAASDIFLGLVGIGFTQFPEQEKARQYFYGNPGNFRFTKYPGDILGWEYRTPSVTWQTHYDATENIFRGVSSIVEYYQTGELQEIVKQNINEAKEAIVNCDIEKARSLWESLVE